MAQEGLIVISESFRLPWMTPCSCAASRRFAAPWWLMGSLCT